jgi:glucose/arabinose dehydrogenase
MHRRIVLAATAALTAALAWQPATKVDLPKPYHTPSANNRPQVVERPNGAKLTVPAGFTIEEFATGGFDRPRFLLPGPNGEILLTDYTNNGKVIALIDKNKDLKVDDRKDLLTGLDRPYGLAFWKDYLYVAETTSLKRYKYDSKALTVGPGQEVVSWKDFKTGHSTRTVTFDAKGEKMYLAVGSQSNVDHGEPEQRAAIAVANPDGSHLKIFAAGTRNPIGLRLYPGTNTLWAAVQERDHLGDDLVPDYFTSIKEGGFYGWPYAYIGPNADPRRTERPDLVAKTIVPDVVLGAHVAVLDALFYTGKQFPPEYQGGAFVAQHGSWNRAKRHGYNVIFIPFKNGKPSGPPKEFLGGWMISPDNRGVWGRPVGLMTLADGSLLVTDDGGNKIWRISYKK